ncbi:MAG: S-adenosyl-l-methionine hydroxide adenosyltransferase family protein [Flavobacteriales bacterium]
MGLITLTTDMGLQDHYDAVVKATILKECPDARIIDISHQIPPFDIARASFVLKNAFRDFPEGSVHILGVDPDLEEGKPHLIARYQGQYFIAADNGILSLIFEEKPEGIVVIDRDISREDITFPTKGVFAKVACRIVQGTSMEELGSSTDDLVEKSRYRPVVDGNTLRGTIIHIDSYDNAITNIDKALFEDIGQGRSFTLRFRSSRNEIRKISDHYSDVPPGENVALFGSSGYLEVAINKGAPGSGEGARRLFGLKQDDSVHVEFHDR